MYEELYCKFKTKDWAKDAIYKFARLRERKTRGLTQVKCINEENQVLVEDEIQERWKSCFNESHINNLECLVSSIKDRIIRGAFGQSLKKYFFYFLIFKKQKSKSNVW